jgi:hypothetical protein
VFTYRCLSCGKLHNNADSFAQDFEAKCLRCAHAFTVTRAMIRPVHDATARHQQNITTRAVAAGSTAKSHNSYGIIPADAGPDADPEAATGSLPDLAIDAGGVSRTKPQKLDPSAISDDMLDAVELRKPLDADEDAAGVPEETGGPKGKKKKKKSASPEQDKQEPKKKPWLLIAGVVGPVLLLSVGGYLVFGRPKKPTGLALKPSPPANPTPAAKTPAKTPPAKKDEKKEVVIKEPVKPVPSRKPNYILSAPRLAAEVARDPVGTDRKYKDAVLEVSGLFEKFLIQRPKGQESLLRGQFRTGKGTILCDVRGATVPEINRWQRLRYNHPITVHGVYSKAGVLVNCRLQELTAGAEQKYKGKTIEVEGIVEEIVLPGPRSGAFPRIALEKETNAAIEVRCYFQKIDLDEVKKVVIGSRVIVRGVCGGRQVDIHRNSYHVRIDNSKIIHTTGPEPGVPRIDGLAFGREYEEDMRPFFLPARGQEERITGVKKLSQLNDEWKADPTSLEKNYLHKIITIEGRLYDRGGERLILESPDTNHILKVSCRFNKALYPELGEGPVFRLSGLCAGMEEPQTMRLDNCDVDASQLKQAVPVLTDDYLPHKPGEVLTYDLAKYQNPATIFRLLWYQRDGGITETVITHHRRWTGKTIFTKEKDKADNWIGWPKTKKERMSGPVYVRSYLLGTILFGERTRSPTAGMQVSRNPALKLGVKAGATWEWVRKDTKHVYTLEKFDKWRGLPCAIIKEVIVTPVNTLQQGEVRHVYVKGIGEVERREWFRLTSTETKLIAEMKIILPEDVSPRPDKKLKTPGDKSEK